MMYKRFELIPMEGGYVAVDKEASIEAGTKLLIVREPLLWGKYHDICTVINNSKKDRKCEILSSMGSPNFAFCSVEYAIHDGSVIPVIAHKGIPSLKDSGLPTFEIIEPSWELASTYASTRWDKTGHSERWKDAKIDFWGGHKAAGGYTEEDIRSAFQAGKKYEEYRHAFPDRVKDEKMFINSLKKKPVAIEVEMDIYRHPDTGKEWFGGYDIADEFHPKIVNNQLVIKEVIYE